MSEYFDVPDMLTLLAVAPLYPSGVVACVQYHARGQGFVGAMHMECAMGGGWQTLKDNMSADTTGHTPTLALFATREAYDDTHSLYATPLCVHCAKGIL